MNITTSPASSSTTCSNNSTTPRAYLHIPYPQILNTQKVATDLYGITGIPHIILFSSDGTVLSRGLRGPQIMETLAGVLEP